MFNTLLVTPLFNLLAIIYNFIPDFGIAVIILTIIVRLAVWPLVTKQLHSQKAMQELAPHIAKIKEKSKGDKQKESQMLMELYKEKEINPFASFLPLLIQFPILIALFIVLRDIVRPGEIASLTYDFVANLSTISAVIENNNFNATLLGMVNLARPNIVLAAAAGAVQYVQAKHLTPKKALSKEQQSINSAMLIIFPILTFIIGLTLPSALPLYWIVTSLVAFVQQRMVLQRDVEEMEAMKK